MRVETTRKSYREWSLIVAAFERSGCTHGEFCERRGLTIGNFRSWLYRVRRSTRGSTGEVAMLPVSVTPHPLAMGSLDRVADASPGCIVITVGDVAVRLAAHTDVTYLATLVGELRSRC